VYENVPNDEQWFYIMLQRWRDTAVSLERMTPTTTPDLSAETFERHRGHLSAYKEALRLVATCPSLAEVGDKVHAVHRGLMAGLACAQGMWSGEELQGAREAYASLLTELSRHFPDVLRLNDRRTYGLVEATIPPQESTWYEC
jgi:hypothetical protein